MQDLSQYNNESFRPGANIFVRVLWYIVNSILFDSSIMPISKVKVVILRLFGAQVGCCVTIKQKVNIKYPWNLKIGNYVWIGESAWIDNLTKVTIGNNVCISQGVYLLTGNHNYRKKSFDLIVKEIVVEDGVWIGARSVICPGVILAMNCVVTVGQVIVKNTVKDTIYLSSEIYKTKPRVGME